MLTAIEYCSGHDPHASIIWLHGLGADGSDFLPIARQLALPIAVRFVFPNAPSMPVTINGGYVMPAWYDIAASDIAATQDEAGIRRAQGMIEELIEREIERGVSASSIVLAGFSQGGAIALQTGLRFRQKLGGIIVLSAYLPLRQTLEQERSPANDELPILMAHGTADTVIPIAVGRSSAEYLARSGYGVVWQEYPMPHTVCAEEIEAIGAFLLGILPNQPGTDQPS
jgi:phospholipase/carboxylesterase